MRNRFTTMFFSAFGDAGAGSFIDPYAIPDSSVVEVGQDGVVRIYETAPAGGGAPAAPAPLVASDLRGFVDDLREAVKPQQTAPPPAAPPALPEFDPTRFINDDQSIDMVGLGKGISEHTLLVARAAAAAAIAEVDNRYGAPVGGYAVQSFADKLAAAHSLGDVGRQAIINQIQALTPSQIQALDENSIGMLIDHAENRERKSAALVADSARPGGAPGARLGAELTLAIDDPKKLGWPGYCEIRGWNPSDKAAIAEGRRTGVLR